MTGKSGFSLVELIVVIAIMAVMAAVLAPALLGYVERSRAQKDDSAMGEVTNAIQLSLADQNVYDELLPYAVKGNFSCYCDGDTSTNTDANKIITKAPDYWLFTDEARKLDETAYFPAGSMRGATVTFKPNGEAEYILKAGIVNQIGDESTKKGTNGGAVLEDCPELYNRLRSTIGDTIKVSSQTYRNSTYTIFISMGTTGGNQADKQDAIKVYGQYNGTNLPEVMTATGSASQDKGNAGSGGSGGSGGEGSEQPTTCDHSNLITYVDDKKCADCGYIEYGDKTWNGLLPENSTYSSNGREELFKCPNCSFSFEGDYSCWCGEYQVSDGIDKCDICPFDFNNPTCLCEDMTGPLPAIPGYTLNPGDAFPDADKMFDGDVFNHNYNVPDDPAYNGFARQTIWKLHKDIWGNVYWIKDGDENTKLYLLDGKIAGISLKSIN